MGLPHSRKRLGALATALALSVAVAGCQQRVGGLAPLTIGSQTPLTAGGAVIAMQGDSLYALSRRYEVPLRDLIEINGLSPPYTLEIGQRVLLPASRQYVVRTGDTLYSVSRMFGVDVSELSRLNNLAPPYGIRSGQPLRLPAPAAGYQGGNGPVPSTGGAIAVAAAPRPAIERNDFNPAAPSVTYESGREPRNLQVPSANPPGLRSDRTPSTAGAARPEKVSTITVSPPAAPSVIASAPVEVPAETAPESAREPPAPSVTAPSVVEPAPSVAPNPVEAPSRKPAPSPAVVAAAPAAPPAAQSSRAPADSDAPSPARSSSRFLMPVQGRLLSGFGPKPGGLHNDGLNIAAPRGTPVVAADNGVVAYAGNELRGFGNLLLIRHADGWITAYAHLDHMEVARGAEVKRGQAIGAVGQSGGVPSPQLHFELRKGNQAVDPKGQMGG